MHTLEISTSGSVQVQLGSESITRFRTQKLQALLIYLAVERSKLHRRETLMGLLWPDFPDKSARDTLRQTLSLLRKRIPTQTNADGIEIPFLLSDRQSVQVNPEYPMSVDTHQFQLLAQRGTAEQDPFILQQAADLIQGEFLSDFYLSDSNPFENWSQIHREKFHRSALDTLQTLTSLYLERYDFSSAEAAARQQIELDPLHEAAFRQLMLALALNGRRQEALVQYDVLYKRLWDQLGVTPEAATLEVLAQVEADRIALAPSAPAEPQKQPLERPVFLEVSAMTPPSEHDQFVARGEEREQLRSKLAETIEAQKTGILVVTGEAGQGKTALLQAFMKEAILTHDNLLIANGTCSSITGTGDPYQPIRQCMTMLCGDLESRWMLGAISSKWARRLWQSAPTVIDTIIEQGPGLPGTIVPLPPIEKRTGGAYQAESAVSQPALFAQLTAVLRSVAQGGPLVLVFDDMQWADSGTINLFFHLGRHLQKLPVLLVCAYRPSDVAMGRNGERHPLASVLQELKRIHGETVVPLEEADHKTFVEALLNSQPNQFDDQFRSHFYNQTGGHALFTIELLREMQERGDLVLDATIKWTSRDSIDWSALPSKVESAMAERIDRLPNNLRELLKVACVEGESFTAELLASILNLSPRDLVLALSTQLDQQHRLVEVVGIDRIGGQRFSRYRFRHHLIYKYLLSIIDPVEWVYTNESVAEALLSLIGDGTRTVAAQLSKYYEHAGVLAEAVSYQVEAGDEAVRIAATQTAQLHFEHALSLLEQMPPSAEQDATKSTIETKLSALPPVCIAPKTKRGRP